MIESLIKLLRIGPPEGSEILGDSPRDTLLPERDTAKLALVQNSKDDGLREAGDLDRPDLIAREHFGGIAGIPDVHGEWPEPFCRPQSIRGLGICAAHQLQ